MDDETIKNLNEIITQKNLEIQQLTLSLEKEKLKSKKDLEAAHDFYENIIAFMPGHVYWLDRNNVFLGCNDEQAQSARLSSRKEIVGKTNYDLPWKDQAEELIKLNNLVMESGIPHVQEEYAVMASGMGIYYSQKVPLRNQANEIIGVLGMSLDITERKKMEVALRRAKENAEVANQAKTEFIANMSHDLHTPLMGIVEMSQLLEEKTENPEEKQYARWIHDSGEQLLDLLNGVMELVSADNLKEDDVREELFELRKNISDIAHLVQPSLEMKKIQLNIEIDKTVPHSVITDGIKLHRVLLNLIGNAIKFTPAGIVTIKIETLANDNNYTQLRFSVIDTGIGIPDELQGKIFDRFFRAIPSYKSEHGSYGISLHISKKYLSLLGGEINLVSEVGKGSTFYFTLSMKIGYNESNPSAKLPLKKITNSPLILLVEDNIVSLHMIENLVEQAEYPFYSAIDGEHALELLETIDFDLIITDIGIPGDSGNNLIESIRDLEKRLKKKRIPIIGLTTNTSGAMENESLHSELSKVLTKPIHLKVLQEAVNKLGT